MDRTGDVETEILYHDMDPGPHGVTFQTIIIFCNSIWSISNLEKNI